MELRAWRIIVPLPRPLQFILTILKKKELQHLFHQIFTNFPNTEGICNAVACESHQRTRPLLAILNFSMWSTSVFTTEKKTEPAESEALKLLQLGQHQVGSGFTLPTVKRFSPTSGIVKPAVNRRKPLETARNDNSN